MPRHLVNRIGKVAARLLVGSIPLVILFFVALPRTTIPLWTNGEPVVDGRQWVLGPDLARDGRRASC